MSVGPTEVIILVFILIVLFGAKKLPDAARSVGRSMRIFKSEVKEMQHDDEEAERNYRASQPQALEQGQAYNPQAGYTQPQQPAGFNPQQGYTPQQPQQGYPPQQPQQGLAPSAGYDPQNGYPQQPPRPQGGYPHTDPMQQG